jgi:hypothetical protein
MLIPLPAKPAGTQPFDSLECWLMYEPNVTVTWFGFFGFTAPDG